MAIQDINLGTGANTGSGDPILTAFTKVKANEEALFNVGGWGYYQDDASSNITVSTSDTLLTINGLGTNTSNSYLPLEIRGISDLWSSNKMNAISIGDSYDLRLDFTVASKTCTPTYLDMAFDIGGGVSPTIPIVQRTISLNKTPPYSISIGFPLFSLSTFVSNGGQIFMKTDTGSLDISARAIFIKRDYKNI